jgi:hypothetical protein
MALLEEVVQTPSLTRLGAYSRVVKVTCFVAERGLRDAERARTTQCG